MSAVWRISLCVFLRGGSSFVANAYGPSSDLCLSDGARFVCSAALRINKETKHARNDAMPFFGPRHFPLFLIGVVSSAPPNNAYRFSHGREVILFGDSQRSSRSTVILSRGSYS